MKSRDDRLLQIASLAVVVFAFVLALPAFFVPLGLPIEGDGVDYRVPLIRWMLRHGAYPNWPWTMVDDYPTAGELLMLPFYALHPALARVVPLLGYLGFGAAAGAIAARLGEGKCGLSRRALFLTGCAWALALRPAALQSNALMNDTLTAAFLLGSLACLLEKRIAWAGVLTALALGTRYSAWGSAACLPIIAFLVADGPRLRKAREMILFSAIAGLGALPFMTRNFLVNDRHPFFPVDSPAVMANWGVLDYGRGSDLLSFLLLPFDLLYTNSFERGIFDYTLGKLFYLQLLALLAAFAWRLFPARKASRIPAKKARDSRPWLAALFAFVHLVVWFRSSQQLRFLVPALMLLDLGILLLVARWAGPRLLAASTLAGALSVLSVQMDSVRIALGRQESPFVRNAAEAEDCFRRAGVGSTETIGYLHRDGMLGFFDHDFTFLQTHTYSVPGQEPPPTRWVYTQEPLVGYVPWPGGDPCLLKRGEL